MSDNQNVLALLREAGGSGIHSHQLRHDGITGDPAARMRDLRAKGHYISAQVERRGKRHGTRYTLHPDVKLGAARHDAPFSDEAGGAPGGVELDARDSRVSAPAATSPVVAGTFLRSLPEVNLARLERACEAAKAVAKETGRKVTLEDAVLVACSADQQALAA